MDDVRDELFRAASRVVGRPLGTAEKDRLVEAYNEQDTGTIFDRCVAAIEQVFNVDLQVRQLVEKSASVDRIRLAIANLQMVATQAASKK